MQPVEHRVERVPTEKGERESAGEVDLHGHDPAEDPLPRDQWPGELQVQAEPAGTR